MRSIGMLLPNVRSRAISRYVRDCSIACCPAKYSARFWRWFEQAVRLVDRCSLLFPTIDTTAAHILTGARLAERYRLQFWDAVIIAVSLDAGAELLLSEDMQNGLVIDGLTIVNPFAPESDERLRSILQS